MLDLLSVLTTPQYKECMYICMCVYIDILQFLHFQYYIILCILYNVVIVL